MDIRINPYIYIQALAQKIKWVRKFPVEKDFSIKGFFHFKDFTEKLRRLLIII